MQALIDNKLIPYDQLTIEQLRDPFTLILEDFNPPYKLNPETRAAVDADFKWLLEFTELRGARMSGWLLVPIILILAAPCAAYLLLLSAILPFGK